MKRALLILMCLFLTAPARAEEPKAAPILQVKLKTWDESALEKAFFGGRDVEMEKDEHGTLSYRNGDAEAIYASHAGFDFRSMNITMNDTFVLTDYDRSEPSGGEIEGFPLDGAVKMLKDTLSPIGVEAGEVFRYSAIKREDFEALRIAYARHRREEYAEYESIEAGLLREKATLDGFAGRTPPDDGYLLRVARTYKGIVCQLSRDWKDPFGSSSAYITAYVTSSGVQHLEINDDLFSVVGEKTPFGKRPISRAKAERIFKSALKGDGASLDITRAAYEYAPVPRKNTVYLRPAWCFYAKTGAEPGSDWYIVGAVDAYTGRVL